MYYHQFPLMITFVLWIKNLLCLTVLSCLRAESLALFSLPQVMSSTSTALNAMDIMT